MDQIIDDFTDDDKVTKESNLWNYREEHVLLGVVTNISDGTYGKSVEVSVNADGDTKVLPNLTALTEFINTLEVGNKIKLVYTGEVRSSITGRMFASFDLYKK